MHVNDEQDGTYIKIQFTYTYHIMITTGFLVTSFFIEKLQKI